MQNGQTEPKGYPKAYKGTTRVKFVRSKKNKAEKPSGFSTLIIDNPSVTS